MFKKTKRKIRRSRKGIETAAGDKKNQCICILVLALLVGVGMSASGWSIGIFGPVEGDTTTTTTTTDTTITTTTDTTTTDTTTTTTTTPPEEDDLYIIRFRFIWGDSIAEADKCWLEFSVYDYHDITPTGRRDMATFAAAATSVWYPGSWGAVFTEGESLSIGMAAFSGWYDLEDPHYVDVSVGPWSHSFTFHSYKYGFSVILTGTLMINWELV